MLHELKILPSHFEDVISGAKKFELRRDDRGFKVGDELWLGEWIENEDGEHGTYTGRVIVVYVTHILKGGQFGLTDGYVILSISEEQPND